MLSEQQQRIMGYFIEEAKDHLNTIEQGLLNLKATIEDPEMVHEVFRAAHSVKGGAAMLGLTSIQHTAHRLEDYFKILKECPIKIDQKLETLLLRVYDTLGELLEQLQGPFGLTDDKAEGAMASVEPVFTELNLHLGQLVAQAGAQPPEDVNLVGSAAPAQTPAPRRQLSQVTTEESALRFIFQNDVPARLREMLQLFKQVDTPDSRQQLQALCRSLMQSGEQLDIPAWCGLLEMAEQAIANPDNTYRTLAPVVIKDIKRAQEQVLAGHLTDIGASEELLALVPKSWPTDESITDAAVIDESVTDADFADLLAADAVDRDELALFAFEAAEADSSLAELSDLADMGAGEFDAETAELPFIFDSITDDSDDPASAFNFIEQPEEATPTIEQPGPEVGMAELNTLADLFEGENPDLGLTWQEEIIDDSAAQDPTESLELDSTVDFSDLLFQDGAALVLEESDDDLSDLLNNTQPNNTQPTEPEGESSEPIFDFDGTDIFPDPTEDILLDLASGSEAESESVSFEPASFEPASADAMPEPGSQQNLDELFAGLAEPSDLVLDSSDAVSFTDLLADDSSAQPFDLEQEDLPDFTLEMPAASVPFEPEQFEPELDNADDFDLSGLQLEAQPEPASALPSPSSEPDQEDWQAIADPWGEPSLDDLANFDLTAPENLMGNTPDAEAELFTLDSASNEPTAASPDAISLQSDSDLLDQLNLNSFAMGAEADLADLDFDLSASGLLEFSELPSEAAETLGGEAEFNLDTIGAGDSELNFTELAAETSEPSETSFDFAEFTETTETPAEAFDELDLTVFGEAEIPPGSELDVTESELTESELTESELTGLELTGLELTGLELTEPTENEFTFDSDLNLFEDSESSAGAEFNSDLNLFGDSENLTSEEVAGSAADELSTELDDLFAADLADLTTAPEALESVNLSEFELPDDFAEADSATPANAAPENLASEDLDDLLLQTDPSGPENSEPNAELDTNLNDFLADTPELTQPAPVPENPFAEEELEFGLFETDSDVSSNVAPDSAFNLDLLAADSDPRQESTAEEADVLAEMADFSVDLTQNEDSNLAEMADFGFDLSTETQEATPLTLDELGITDTTAPLDTSLTIGEQPEGEVNALGLDSFDFDSDLGLPSDNLLDDSLDNHPDSNLTDTLDDSDLELAANNPFAAADADNANPFDLNLDLAETEAEQPDDEINFFDLETDDTDALTDLFSEGDSELAEISSSDGSHELTELTVEETDFSLEQADSLDADLSNEAEDFDPLNSLLAAENTLDFGEISAEPAAFSDLEAMLAEDTPFITSVDEDEAEPPVGEEQAVVDARGVDARGVDEKTNDFSDLEALLEDEPEVAAVPEITPAPVEDEFSDLEALLQDADQALGVGSSPTRKSTAASNRRPSRRSGLSDQTMRVSVKHLDNLNNLVGEMVVNRNSLEQAGERLRQFLDNLLYQVQQLSDVGQRMRDLYERSLLESSLLSSRRGNQTTPISGFGSGQTSHATGLSFDALEMDRFTGFHTLSQEMIELIVRVRESASDIDFVVEETDQVTRNFRQITTQLQEGLTRSRMVPFAHTADRLPRGVRDNSLKYGKQAELVIEGRDTLIDKMIVEQLYDPMTHLVNNAIAHGIETPEERIAAGKSPTGRIAIRAFHQGNQTVISVSDDGAGINPEKVRAKALAKGLITAAQAREMSRLDTYDLLFHHGFSTVDQVDDLRGRGVGLDVVRSNLNEIRGTISIDSTVGKGTTFTIRLPLTLSISKALCCISNRARIAFPMDGVEDMLDVPKERIQTDEQGRQCIQWRDTLLPFQSLSDLLRYNRVLGRGSVYGGNQEEDIISIVVLRSAGNFLALQVDQVLGEQEIVIKQLEGPIPKPLGVAGATVLGDGRIMPIADVLELIDLWQGRIRRESGSSLWDKGEAQVPPESMVKTEPTVLIVDDSITVRELLSMTFSKVGYRVEQARDGQEAWEKLRSGLPCDLVFCDIEMPRMDGLELLSRIQKDANLSHLPIAMLTSRGADRHRQMAVQLGAKGYFTKPYLEEVLLDAAQRMLKGEVMISTTNIQ
jgi:chemosensory pili system protein ChpA (sensor histidine kinase/response regulator)